MTSFRLDERLVKEQDRMIAKMDYTARAKTQLLFNPGRIGGRRRSARFHRSRWWAAAGVAVVVLAALFRWYFSPITASFEGRAVAVGERVFGKAGGGNTLAFSDGSEIELTRDAGLSIRSADADGATIVLEQGRIRASITHRNATRWKLHVGPYLVEVKGTRFALEWIQETQSFEIDLKEGAVEVTGPLIGPGRPIFAGQKMIARLSDQRVEIRGSNQMNTTILGRKADGLPAGTTPTEMETASKEAVSPEGEIRAAGNRPDMPSRTVSTAKNESWKSAARAGRYADAAAAARKQGVEDILRKASSVDLMTLGDAARRGSDAELALFAYKAVRRRFPNSKDASAAAFSIGLIAFDFKGDYKEAAKWFEMCATSKKPGPFAREAAGRWMEALSRSGRRESARAAAERYLADYPNGPHAPSARKLAGPN